VQKDITNLKYTPTHEWIALEDNNHVTLGITQHAQESLGDVVYVELPEVDTLVEKEEQICVVESSKAAAEVYSPVAGTIIAVNTELEDNPEYINESPYDKGWVVKIKINNTDESESLLSYEQYQDIN
jgi:glycine cleavage system H protein